MKNYDNSTVRRQDRLLKKEKAFDLLANGEYGFLSLTDGNEAYGIPISYVYDNEKIYFHCAPEGKKLTYINKNSSVCFCIIGKTCVQPSKFTTLYESILVFGTIAEVNDEDEKRNALMLLIDKYSPEHKETGIKYAQKSFLRTKILRLEIHHISGKSKDIK